MPQQSKTKKTTKNQKKKLSKMPFVYIIILLIAVVIMVCLVVRNNQSKEEKSKTQQNTEETEQQENIILPEQTIIDFNNTENAKVEGSVKENTSSKLLEPKTYKGLTFKDIKLVAEAGKTQLTATVENNSSQDYAAEGLVIIFTNKDGSEYSRLEGALPAIPAGGTNELDASTTSDVANAYNFTIEAQ